MTVVSCYSNAVVGFLTSVHAFI